MPNTNYSLLIKPSCSFEVLCSVVFAPSLWQIQMPFAFLAPVLPLASCLAQHRPLPGFWWKKSPCAPPSKILPSGMRCRETFHLPCIASNHHHCNLVDKQCLHASSPVILFVPNLSWMLQFDGQSYHSWGHAKASVGAVKRDLMTILCRAETWS